MMDQRGLIITNAGLTKDAIVEAGASAKAPISLMDGKRFVRTDGRLENPPLRSAHFRPQLAGGGPHDAYSLRST